MNHGSYISTNSNMSLIESLRSLLRALTIHEKEIFKIATENLFMLNFISTQFDASRPDPLRQVDEMENSNDEEVENPEVGVVSIDNTDWSGNWDSAWKDEDEQEGPVVDGSNFEHMLEDSISRFAPPLFAPTEDLEDQNLLKKSKKNAADKGNKRSTRSTN